MITVSGTNTDRDVGILTEDLLVSGTNADVRCAVPHGVSISINITGTNPTVEIGGRGEVSLQISGTNVDVTLGVGINANTAVTGQNVSVTTEPLPQLTQRVDGFDAAASEFLENTHYNDNTSIPSIDPQSTAGQQHDEEHEESAGPEETVVYEADSEESENTRVYEGEDSSLVECPQCGATLHDQNPKFCAQCGTSL